MAAVKLQKIETQLEELSHSEQLSVIEYLVKLLQQDQAESQKTERNEIESIFSLMDSAPVYSNGQKWTRDELHER